MSLFTPSKGEVLWLACTEGNLPLVQNLLADPLANVNWEDAEHRRTPFYRACGHGRLEVVKAMLLDPRVNVNHMIDEGATAIYIACQQGFPEVVELLTWDDRVDVNLPRNDQVSPILAACENEKGEVVSRLVACPRVNVNAVRSDGVSGLWYASQEGFLDIVKIVLAGDHEVDTSLTWNGNKNTAKIQAIDKGRKAIAQLLGEYEVDPEKVRKRLQLELDIYHRKAAGFFALSVLLADEYLKIKAPENLSTPLNSLAARYLKISSVLPIELQMVLANITVQSTSVVVLSRYSEPEFRKMAFIFDHLIPSRKSASST